MYPTNKRVIQLLLNFKGNKMNKNTKDYVMAIMGIILIVLFIMKHTKSNDNEPSVDTSTYEYKVIEHTQDNRPVQEVCEDLVRDQINPHRELILLIDGKRYLDGLENFHINKCVGYGGIVSRDLGKSLNKYVKFKNSDAYKYNNVTNNKTIDGKFYGHEVYCINTTYYMNMQWCMEDQGYDYNEYGQKTEYQKRGMKLYESYVDYVDDSQHTFRNQLEKYGIEIDIYDVTGEGAAEAKKKAIEANYGHYSDGSDDDVAPVESQLVTGASERVGMAEAISFCTDDVKESGDKIETCMAKLGFE